MARERKIAAGLKRIEVWVPPNSMEAVRLYVRRAVRHWLTTAHRTHAK
jgi:hypothetical protein